MAGRKGAGIQLQQEITTDEEWEALIEKRGLIVVDIFSGWCGPCVGMVANLKKIKLEIGGDLLILATAQSDTITILERFRERSEPCWMFISGKKIVNLMFGANAPQLMKLITQELEKEKASQRTGRPREGKMFFEHMPAEVQRNEYEKKRDEQRRAKMEDVEKQKLKERHEKDVAKLTEALKADTVVLFLPFTYDKETKAWLPFDTLMEMLGPSFTVKEEIELDLSVAEAQKIFNIFYDEEEEDEEEEDLIDDLKDQLEKGKCLAAVIGTMGAVATPESGSSDQLLAVEAAPSTPAVAEPVSEVDVMKSLYDAVYGVPEDEEEQVAPPEDEEEEDEGEEEGDEGPKSILAHLTEEYGWMTAIPGVWAPKSEREKAEAVLVLFKEFSETIVGPPPPVLPPHVAIAFDARTYPDLQETLAEYENEVLKSAFFNDHNPDTARRVADNYDELHLIVRTGTEKFVIMLDNTKNEALLALAQYGPTFVSQDTEEGKEDCFKLFPDEDADKGPGMGAESEAGAAKGTDASGVQVTVTEIDEESKDEEEDYDPLALRESKKIEAAEITSVVSGFEDEGDAASVAPQDAGEGGEGEEGEEAEGTPPGEEGAPAEGAPAEGAPAEGAPAEGAPAEGAPDEGAPAEPAAEKPEGEAAAPAEEKPEEEAEKSGEAPGAEDGETAAPAEGDKPAEGGEEGAAPAEGETAPPEEAAAA